MTLFGQNSNLNSADFWCVPSGDAHSLNERVEFYDELRTSCLLFSEKDKFFLNGDFNARLGRYYLDQNVHGK